MMRSTAIAVVDQAIMSALNLALALLLIRYAGKHDYGVYSQLVALQSFVSPLHAGVFVSATLALVARKHGIEQQLHKAGMARAELATGITSVALIAAFVYFGSQAIDLDLSWRLCAACATATLGLWWREFIRQLSFASLRADRALLIDVAYVALVGGAVGAAALHDEVGAALVLYVTGVVGIAVSAVPLIRTAASARTSIRMIAANVTESWRIGRWDVLGSIVTWSYSQSYVYFAAAIGGAGAAAEIAAARLLASPLSLLWAGYANVLRPSLSRALHAGELSTARTLAVRASVFVIVASAAYGLLLLNAIDWIQRELFNTGFTQLPVLTALWTLYCTLTGLSTVAASVLRGALQFSDVFWRQLVTAAAALVLLFGCLMVRDLTLLVLVLVAIEAVAMLLIAQRSLRLLAPTRAQNALPQSSA